MSNETPRAPAAPIVGKPQPPVLTEAAGPATPIVDTHTLTSLAQEPQLPEPAPVLPSSDKTESEQVAKPLSPSQSATEAESINPIIEPSDQQAVEQTPETSPTPERAYPSGKLMWHIAHGKFETTAFKPDQPATKVSEKSYQALEAHHDTAREKDSALRQQDAAIQQAIATMRQSGVPESQIAIKVHSFEMSHWSHKQALRLEKFLEQAPDKKALITALNKIGFSITTDTPNNITLQNALYKMSVDGTSGEYGEFYKKFCKREINTNEALANTLSAEDMDVLKPFLVDVLGGEQAFKALIALRQTKDMVAETQADPAKQTEVYKAKPDLNTTAGEQETLDFFKAGDDLAKKKRDAGAQQRQQPTQPTHSPTTESPGGSEREHIPTLSSKGVVTTEVNPDHPTRNDDISFFDEAHARGGIFDGAGGYGGGNIASRAAQETIQRVMAELAQDASDAQIKDHMKKAFEAANQAVRTKQQETNNHKASTTASVFQIVESPNGERKVIVANVGDSRVWIRRADGSITQVTEDWNNLRTDFIVQLRQLQAKIPPNTQEISKLNQWYKSYKEFFDSVTTRKQLAQLPQAALNRYFLERNVTGLLGAASYPLEFFEEKLEAGDMLFMTTDGVHDNLTRKEIEAIVKENVDPDALTKALVAKAREVSVKPNRIYPRAKKDDITVGAISLESRAKITSPILNKSDREAENSPSVPTPEKIKELAGEAYWYMRRKRQEPPPTQEFGRIAFGYSGNEALMSAMGDISRDPDDIGRHFYGHGIAKGSLKDQLQALVNILQGDKARGTSTSVILSRSNTNYPVYSDGGFVLIGPKDKFLLRDDNTFDVNVVAVNEQFYHAIPTLQVWFPNVRFVKAEDLYQAMKQEVRPPNLPS